VWISRARSAWTPVSTKYPKLVRAASGRRSGLERIKRKESDCAEILGQFAKIEYIWNPGGQSGAGQLKELVNPGASKKELKQISKRITEGMKITEFIEQDTVWDRPLNSWRVRE